MATSLDEETAPKLLKPWEWSTRALIAYRSGDTKSAILYVQKSENENPADVAHALNLAVRSMAQHQLGDFEMALTDAQQCAQAIGKMLNADARRTNRNGMLIAKILLREAKALIDGEVEPKPAGTTTPAK